MVGRMKMMKKTGLPFITKRSPPSLILNFFLLTYLLSISGTKLRTFCHPASSFPSFFSFCRKRMTYIKKSCHFLRGSRSGNLEEAHHFVWCYCLYLFFYLSLSHSGGSTPNRFFTKKSARLCSPKVSPMVWWALGTKINSKSLLALMRALTTW